MARACVEDELAATIRDLTDPGDGPTERLIVGRAAICAIDARMADLEHLQAMVHYDDARDAEVYDRRRDRAQRRLLHVLRTLADVRRMRQPMVRVNQLNVGEGNVNLLQA
jgi:hypothetical protein